MKNINLEITSDNICSCNSCGALNYEPSIELMRSKKRVDTLYALQIGNMCSILCEDCVAEVVKICAAIKPMEDKL